MEQVSPITIEQALSGRGRHREELRAKLLAQAPRLYCPATHIALPSLAGLGLIVAAALMLRDTTVWQLSSIPVWFVLLNACEWTIHRNLLHHRSWAFYDRHTPEHHALFVGHDMAIRSVYEFRLVLIPIYAVFTLFAAAVPIAAAFALLGQRNLGLLFFASAVGYVLIYEWLHLAYHLPPYKFLNRWGFFRFLRHHHATHHLPQLMQRWNFNTTVPLWDLVRGTIYKRQSEAARRPVESSHGDSAAGLSSDA